MSSGKRPEKGEWPRFLKVAEGVAVELGKLGFPNGVDSLEVADRIDAISREAARAQSVGQSLDFVLSQNLMGPAYAQAEVLGGLLASSSMPPEFGAVFSKYYHGVLVEVLGSERLAQVTAMHTPVLDSDYHVGIV